MTSTVSKPEVSAARACRTTMGNRSAGLVPG